jgi:Ca2+-binding RTX toxin-like protein
MASFTGTAGDDNITGSYTLDTFDLSQGGADSAKGRGGGDTFLLGATFGATDALDGGQGTDQLTLNGDYSAGLTVTTGMLLGFETLLLTPGHSYTFTLRDGVNSTFFGFGVYGYLLGAGDTLVFDGSEETSNSFYLYGGGGADRLAGGEAADTFYLSYGGGGNDVVNGHGGNDFFNFAETFTKYDKVDGGAGRDTVTLAGAYNVHFRATTIRNVEQISLVDAGGYKLIFNDANIAALGRLQIDAFALGSAHKLILNGAAETDGVFYVNGGNGKDALIGGAGDDELYGNGGGDDLVGGDGDDYLTGGEGHDELTGGAGQDAFFFDEGHSPFGNPDLINDLALSDVVSLSAIDADSETAGDQAFTLVSSFSGAAGELRLDYDSGLNRTFFLMDTDGDGAADAQLAATGNRTAFVNFEL